MVYRRGKNITTLDTSHIGLVKNDEQVSGLSLTGPTRPRYEGKTYSLDMKKKVKGARRPVCDDFERLKPSKPPELRGSLSGRSAFPS